MKLEKRSALITGGTKGIGAALAILLAEKGCDVAINGRKDDEQAQKVKRTIEDLGQRCAVITGDIGNKADINNIVEQSAAFLGGVNVLVHSAGGGVAGGIDDIKEEDWYAGFDVHVHGAFHLIRAAAPHMKKAEDGSILLLSSVAGIRGNPSVGYATVKGAIVQMTRSLALNFAPHNIRVNCLSPGIIRTDFHKNMSDERKRINIEHRIPLAREGTPEQVAEIGLSLIENDFITGENMVIDGGMSMRVTR